MFDPFSGKAVKSPHRRTVQQRHLGAFGEKAARERKRKEREDGGRRERGKEWRRACASFFSYVSTSSLSFSFSLSPTPVSTPHRFSHLPPFLSAMNRSPLEQRWDVFRYFVKKETSEQNPQSVKSETARKPENRRERQRWRRSRAQRCLRMARCLVDDDGSRPSVSPQQRKKIKGGQKDPQ